ncbi:hypothetical protein WL76_06695 [Burkholderia ubonensis]|uniref:DUF4148 domain-containing protein n=1 Tax=Burkholderia ubonensis TaxID=101571 RepID=A0A105LEX6_9BURK|nr:DUF4148 domain-containing protein [Burkholderia ubonensis]KVT71937.1 hypothetical protein WK56_15900 [Burkholderia ubonensis]KWE58603.1 hypothetical protein WL76_06695 [Burkholderia ubonensis]KWE62440.1 hypothetical protein WL77_25125 [Burkholderia ubonensis]KWE76163.1 hypothetical protein WL79_10445 [Burkholderia ubonensis]KWK72884.1 hypothetical protein WM16_17610 [Burkholderia ubonensis]
MKAARMAALFVAATLSLGIAAQAAHAQGKTRAQVVDELKQAQHDGIVPASKTQYPPTTDIVTRNKELHGISVHAGDASPQADRHDNLAGR